MSNTAILKKRSDSKPTFAEERQLCEVREAFYSFLNDNGLTATRSDFGDLVLSQESHSDSEFVIQTTIELDEEDGELI